MDGEEVRFGQYVVEADQLNADRLGVLGGNNRVESNHPHAEGQSPLSYLLADLAETQDTERLPIELDSLQGVALPAPCPKRRVRLRDAPRLGKQQRHRVLGSGDRGGVRGIHDHDSSSGGGIEVDVLQPDPGPPDDLEHRCGTDHLLIHACG